MKTARGYFIVLVTTPNLRVARALVRSALGVQLAACANLVPGVESHYWWRGKRERSAEVLIVFKTNRANLPRLERLILARHPYDTPEFVALPLAAGSKRYLDWIGASVK